MHLSDEDIVRRKAYLEVTEEDERRLASSHPTIVKHAPEIIERFYAYLLSHEYTRKMLQAPGLLERLKKVQTDYFMRLTSGLYDRAYFEDRIKVGFAHQRVGLSSEWYLGAYNKYLEIVSDVLQRAFGWDKEAYLRTMVALTKIVHLDMSLAIDAYIATGQEKIAQLDEMKRQLTEMIVHDLQNPLAGIQAFFEHLKAGGRLTAGENEALEEALARCGDLGNMIQNVLQIRKMDEGRMELYVEEVDLREFVPRCASAFDLVAKLEGKSLSVEVPASPVRTRTDHAILQRILFNLIRNSIRHTPKGTAIRVRLSESREISVTDTGAGIPKEFHDVIFERFGASKARGVGFRGDTGLGLPFCRMAATALGASIALDSAPGRGATFTLRLPEPPAAV